MCDIPLGEDGLQLALLLEDVHAIHGLGLVTTAHTEAEIELLGYVCCQVVRRFKTYL